VETVDTLGPIACISDCEPDCIYQWKQNGIDIVKGEHLRLYNISRGQAGTYTCTAINQHNAQGKLSSGVSVIVERKLYTLPCMPFHLNVPWG